MKTTPFVADLMACQSSFVGQSKIACAADVSMSPDRPVETYPLDDKPTETMRNKNDRTFLKGPSVRQLLQPPRAEQEMTNLTVYALPEEGSKKAIGMVNDPRVGDFAKPVGIISKREDADFVLQWPEKLWILDPRPRRTVRGPGPSKSAAQAMHEY